MKPRGVTANGNYITSLFTYRQPACQEWREIDLEALGDAPGRLSTNLITAEKDCNCLVVFRSSFRTIGFEWLPGSIKFY